VREQGGADGSAGNHWTRRFGPYFLTLADCAALSLPIKGGKGLAWPVAMAELCPVLLAAGQVK
jgi:hypothetical protein